VHRLLYDAKCRFCRWSLAWILRWDRRGELAPVALQDPQADELLPGMEQERRMASWHLVSEGGQVISAGAALAPLLRLLPGGRAPAALAAAAPRLIERGYAWVARHRGFLGRRLTDGAVARADAVIAERRAAPD
jgi:predicted DCC family thiol-disulfide oxidoreductase YuxK